MRLYHTHRKKAGSSPGTLVHVGQRHVEEVRLSLFRYDEEGVDERRLKDLDELQAHLERPGMVWLNVDGLHEVSLIERLGRLLDVHPLVLEDVLNTTQRPKLEDYESYLYLVVRMFRRPEKGGSLEWEQVSLVVRSGLVVTFQERVGDVFDPVRERIHHGKGRIRKMGADYLAYALVDAVVDGYFHVLSRLGEQVDDLEGELADRDDEGDILGELHGIRRELVFLKKAVWPLREVVNSLYRGEASLVQKDTRVFVRDLYDHTVQVMETIETLRDMVTGLQDLHLSIVSNRMNRVMQVLGAVGTIFIPLTFLAGIYGMNFEHMPELDWKWAYPALLGFMGSLMVLLVFWFRRKRWL